MKVDNLFQKFALIQQLETKSNEYKKLANECLEQAGAIRTEIEMEINGEELTEKATKKALCTETTERAFSGPQTMVTVFLRDNKPNKYSITDLCAKLGLSKTQVNNAIHQALQKGRVIRAARGVYTYD